MNSQIYCLPQKHGWNALADTGPTRPKKETPKSRNTLYFTVKFDGHETIPGTREEVQKRFPKLGRPGPDLEDRAKAAVYLTETMRSFQPVYLYQKVTPPVTFEKRADPMKSLRPYNPPFDTLISRGPGYDDPDRGLYSWRQLQAKSRDSTWPTMVRRDWATDVCGRSTLPPVRLHPHDPTHEKQRWDYMRHLSRVNGLSYPFRRDLVGYTGHQQRESHLMDAVERDIAHPNPAMESTTQAVHKEFPGEDYQQAPDQSANKHQGPMSRMVTLTHPYNPFTQQSAYSNVGASGTQ